MRRQGVVLLKLYRQQLLNHRLLPHGVDEQVAGQVHAVDLLFAKGVQQDPHRADQIDDVRLLTQMRSHTGNVDIEIAEELHRLGADQHYLGGYVRIRLMLQFHQKVPEQVDVQASAQAAIGGNQDVARGLRFPAGQVGRRVVGPRVVEVACDLVHTVGVRAGGGHPLLGAPYLAGRDHFHRSGDLLRVLDAADLAANFLGAWHFFSSLRLRSS